VEEVDELRSNGAADNTGQISGLLPSHDSAISLQSSAFMQSSKDQVRDALTKLDCYYLTSSAISPAVARVDYITSARLTSSLTQTS
jgi:hypothetical protein